MGQACTPAQIMWRPRERYTSAAQSVPQQHWVPLAAESPVKYTALNYPSVRKQDRANLEDCTWGNRSWVWRQYCSYYDRVLQRNRINGIKSIYIYALLLLYSYEKELSHDYGGCLVSFHSCRVGQQAGVQGSWWLSSSLKVQAELTQEGSGRILSLRRGSPFFFIPLD